VRGVVNTCEEFSGHVAVYEKYRMNQLYIPTIDYNCPSIECIQSAVAFIKEHAARGEAVYGMYSEFLLYDCFISALQSR